MAPNENADGSDNPEGRQQNRRVEIEIDACALKRAGPPHAVAISGSLVHHRELRFAARALRGCMLDPQGQTVEGGRR